MLLTVMDTDFKDFIIATLTFILIGSMFPLLVILPVHLKKAKSALRDNVPGDGPKYLYLFPWKWILISISVTSITASIWFGLIGMLENGVSQFSEVILLGAGSVFVSLLCAVVMIGWLLLTYVVNLWHHTKMSELREKHKIDQH